MEPKQKTSEYSKYNIAHAKIKPSLTNFFWVV